MPCPQVFTEQQRASRKPPHIRRAFALLPSFPYASASVKDLPLEPLLSVSRFHPHPPVALRRSGRAGRGAGEPGPISRVAASGNQHGPGTPPLPRRRLRRPTPPCLRHSRKEIGRKIKNEEEEDRKERGGGRRKDARLMKI